MLMYFKYQLIKNYIYTRCFFLYFGSKYIYMFDLCQYDSDLKLKHIYTLELKFNIYLYIVYIRGLGLKKKIV